MADFKFLFFFIFLHSVSAHFLKFPLLHKSRFPLSPAAALSADKQRLAAFHRRRIHPQLPITSAASSGAGQYLVSIHLGTPPQRLLLVVDTGSDLTWVSCSACRGRDCSSRSGYFFPRRSATFSPYHCFDSACKLVPPPSKQTRCNRTRLHSVCRYEYSYSDGSVTDGFFSHETTAFNTSRGKLLEFERLGFGCGFWNNGPVFNGGNGVLGLGRGPISFPSQLGKRFGRRFSYCLMDYTLAPPPTSYLLIGGGGVAGGSKHDVVGKGRFSYTPLLTNPLSPTFYYIGIESVIINNVKLRISPSVWFVDDLGNGGTVVDSGTTLTFLPAPAYRKILAAFRRLVKLPRAGADPNSGSDLCLNVSGSSRTIFPRLSFRLSGGALFSPPPSNYFIDMAEGVKCLAVQPVAAKTGFSVFGNLIQQGYTFEFDRERSRVGFTRHGCAVP